MATYCCRVANRTTVVLNIVPGHSFVPAATVALLVCMQLALMMHEMAWRVFWCLQHAAVLLYSTRRAQVRILCILPGRNTTRAVWNCIMKHKRQVSVRASVILVLQRDLHASVRCSMHPQRCTKGVCDTPLAANRTRKAAICSGAPPSCRIKSKDCSASSKVRCSLEMSLLRTCTMSLVGLSVDMNLCR